MGHIGPSHPPTVFTPQSGDHALWRLGLLGVLAWQGWMTLCLFDAERTPARLLDDRPVVSGRHPLHLYHGYLGAQARPE